ncbi:hypothetical protein GCM10009851_11320 [Herbiconiux moechotypicola]|uniref:Secreted protein n=2 Tax=Herbiconiux moechotypicola TaxID=637393 RepID=A0ABN3DFF4_9MICO
MASLFLRSGARGSRRAGRAWGRALTVLAAASAVALVMLVVIAPTPQTMAQTTLGPGGAGTGAGGALDLAGLASGAVATQGLSVPSDVAGASVVRDGFGATSGLENLSKGSTNRDWAVLVLYMAGFPTSESNVTVMLRWMRQENGPDNWWLRNNPLNNGWGSGGGSGLGSYDNLVTAAENVGNALHGNSGYAAIVAGFAASAPTSQIEAAIWASPWASSHYANGGHWSYSPVPEVASPAGTWG